MKNNYSLITVLLVAATHTAHANVGYGPATPVNDTLPPVETKTGFANYPPAFAGQTRVPGEKTTTPYKVDKIAQRLGNPFAIVAMPDGRLMVTLKSGTMEIHDKNGALVKKITGLPDVVYAGQGGLAREIFRIACMGELELADLERFAVALEGVVAELRG